MTKPIIVVKVPCKLLYVIQVKEFLIKCLTSWPYLISEFLVAYITIVASDWPRTFFTPKVFLFSIYYTLYGYLCKYAIKANKLKIKICKGSRDQSFTATKIKEKQGIKKNT